MQRGLLIVLGWTAVLLGAIGIFMPILPTTPFMLLAAGCFARSSERFHTWLLQSPVFGAIIRNWQEKGCIEPTVKCWAMCVVVVTFSISIYALNIQTLRYFLAAMMIVSLLSIYRVPVAPRAERK